jgi:hypothetical protein
VDFDGQRHESPDAGATHRTVDEDAAGADDLDASAVAFSESLGGKSGRRRRKKNKKRPGREAQSIEKLQGLFGASAEVGGALLYRHMHMLVRTDL